MGETPDEFGAIFMGGRTLSQLSAVVIDAGVSTGGPSISNS